MSIEAIRFPLPLQSNPEAAAASFVATAGTKFVGLAQKKALPTPPASAEQLKAAVDSVREYVRSFNNNSLEFSINDNTKQIVVKVIDSETQEVIRQIPSEEMLEIASALDHIKGLLVQQKV